jgi:hypothetical protein
VRTSKGGFVKDKPSSIARKVKPRKVLVEPPFSRKITASDVASLYALPQPL